MNTKSSAINFKPSKGMVVVQPFEDEERIIASVDKNYERIGTVIAVASDMEESEIGIGDVIFFDEYAYRRFTYEETDYCIVNCNLEGGLWGLIKNQDARTTEERMPEEGIPAPVPAISDAA